MVEDLDSRACDYRAGDVKDKDLSREGCDHRYGVVCRAQNRADTQVNRVDSRQIESDVLAGHSVWRRLLVDLDGFTSASVFETSQ